MGELNIDRRADRIALLNFRADDITPYIVYWKHGLVEEKV